VASTRAQRRKRLRQKQRARKFAQIDRKLRAALPPDPRPCEGVLNKIIAEKLS
jgi:hypothetical protein